MENKKIERLNDQELEKVSGGTYDTKYAEGEIVKFKTAHDNLTIGKVEMERIGTITAINGNIYTIESKYTPESKSFTYEVEEKDIIGPVIVKTENGAYGGW